MSRAQDREGFQQPVRLRLIETDIDSLESMLDDLRKELKSMRAVMVGILISVATAAILLALNLGIGAFSQGGKP